MPHDIVAPGASVMPGGVLNPPARLRFAGLILDPARGALFGPDGAEIVLRPKTFALLRLLTENAGRLIERDAIMDAVWPDVTVTDDSITQCVGEIRRALSAALGEDGPRLLRTMPRRGYMLDVVVEGVGETVPVADMAEVTVIPVSAPAQARSGRFTKVYWPPVAWTALGAVLAAVIILVFAEWGDGQGQSGEGQGIATASTRVPTPREEAQRLVTEGRAVAQAPGNRIENWLAARRLFERAIALDPGLQAAYAEAVYTYTNVVLRDGSLNPAADLRAAEALAERAVELGPGTADGHAARAAVLRHQGRYAEALAAYRQVVILQPTWQLPRANAAWMQVLLGQPDQAIAPLEALLAAAGPTSPNAPAWRTFLGIAQLYASVGDLGTAMLRSVLNVRTDVPAEVVALHLAAALAVRGDISGARATLAIFRDVRPDMRPDWLRSRLPSPSETLTARQTELVNLLASLWEP